MIVLFFLAAILFFGDVTTDKPNQTKEKKSLVETRPLSRAAYPVQLLTHLVYFKFILTTTKHNHASQTT